MSFNALLIIAEALVMIFELRFLLQSSGADYYHPLTQTIIKITNPVVNLKIIQNIHAGRFFVAALIVSWVISLMFWAAITYVSGITIPQALILGVLMPVKTFGYLLFILLIIQALSSWLPATRSLCLLMSQLTYPVTAPVQRIIPPIGMIDISLMIVIFVLYAVNGICYRIFGSFWAVL